MTIGYLTNQYPAVSHTFVRREIVALEARGRRIERFTIRRSTVALVQPEDLAELARTHCILDRGALGLLVTAFITLLRSPFAWFRALGLCFELGGRSASGKLFHLVYLLEACEFLRLVRRHGVTHVHAHFGTNSAAVAMICRRLGGPTFSFTIHGPDEFDRPYELSLREKIADAEFVAAISQFGQSQVFRWCPAAQWAKVHIVPCGVDAGFMDMEPSRVPPEKRLIWIGRMAHDKGLPILIEACRLLAADGAEFEVVLVGDGPLRADLGRRVTELGLERHVRFAGWLDDDAIRAEIEHSRAMVQPSLAEGLPVVLMEALARGRPAISTRIAAIPELVLHGEAGWIVSPGSPSELAGAMRRTFDAPPDELTAMGAAGRRRSLERHDIRRSAEILDRLFPQGR